MNFIENLEKFELCDINYLDKLRETIINTEVKVIAIFGASCSGKTTLAADLCSKIGHDSAVVLNVDDWWQYNRAEMKALNLTGYDWAARDEKRFLRELEDLKNGTSINKPFQDYHNESPSENSEIVEPKEFIILEATLDFFNVADLVIFTYAEEDVLVQRRLDRDRGSVKATFPSDDLLRNYLETKSLPAYRKLLLPIGADSDFVLDTGSGSFYIKKNLVLLK